MVSNVVVLGCLSKFCVGVGAGFRCCCVCFFARASVLVLGVFFNVVVVCLFTQSFVLVLGSLVSLVVFVCLRTVV